MSEIRPKFGSRPGSHPVERVRSGPDAQTHVAVPHVEIPPSPAEKVLQKAHGYIRHTIGGGANNQCAIFVRKVFREAGVHVGSSTKPTDMEILRRLGLGLDPNCADSFAGDDVGRKVNLREARAGDIVLYRGTDPKYPPMTITHVGIYAGEHKGEHKMIDCGKGGLVHLRAIWPHSLAEIRRPHAYGGGGQQRRWRLAFQGGRANASLDGQGLGHLAIHLTTAPTCTINQSSVKLKAAKVEILWGGDGVTRSDKYYFHNGKMKYLMDGNEPGPGQRREMNLTSVGVAHGDFQLDFRGGTLHVTVNRKEVKPSSVLVELVA